MALDPVLFRAFRSIVVLADCDSGRPIFPVDQLADWLPRWDTWFKRSSGVEDGFQLELLYGRSLQFLGRNFAAHPDGVARISEVAVPLGFGCCVTVTVAECQQAWQDVEALIAKADLGSVYLEGRDTLPAADGVPSVRTVVERLLSCGVTPIFIGPLAVWQEDGLLTSPALNGTNWQLLPEAAPGGQDARLPKVSMVDSAFSPCRERFTVFVTSDGFLYPCQGLAGMAAWSLGHLTDPVTDRILAPGGVHADLTMWAKTGPGSVGNVDGLGGEELAPVCRLHRAEIAATADAGWGTAPAHAMPQPSSSASPTLVSRSQSLPRRFLPVVNR